MIRTSSVILSILDLKQIVLLHSSCCLKYCNCKHQFTDSVVPNFKSLTNYYPLIEASTWLLYLNPTPNPKLTNTRQVIIWQMSGFCTMALPNTMHHSASSVRYSCTILNKLRITFFVVVFCSYQNCQKTMARHNII